MKGSDVDWAAGLTAEELDWIGVAIVAECNWGPLCPGTRCKRCGHCERHCTCAAFDPIRPRS